MKIEYEAGIVRTVRSLAGLSQHDLGALLEVSGRTVSQIEKDGADRIQAGKLFEIAEANGAEVDPHVREVRFRCAADLTENSSLLLSAGRAASGMSQDELGKVADVSRRTIVEYESGKRLPSKRVERDVSRALLDSGVECKVLDPNRGSVRLHYHRAGEANDVLADSGEDMDLATAARMPEILLLKLTLRGLKPTVWREVAISELATFLDLQHAIRIAFQWRTEIAYKFDTGVIVQMPEYPADRISGEAVPSDMLRLTALTRDAFTVDCNYRYPWIIDAEVTGRLVASRPVTAPVLLAGERHGPLEGYGYHTEYSALAERIRRGKASSKDADLLVRIDAPDGFHPDDCPPDTINGRLMRFGFHIPATAEDIYSLNRIGEQK